ncbi:hypothetical protein HGRIS_000809 [Hohenbuehelia grisea]|uniref:Carboxylic ester hydrolase n=1 Tax=Hohenbuehelia grisea TaxID=104357 RepID=A0ABR3IPT9_9AGAR
MQLTFINTLLYAIVPALALVVRDGSSAPIIDLGYAQYQGTTDSATNVTGLLGIRYADPPTGIFRWQAPRAPSNVTGVQQAITQPPQCNQAGSGTSPTNPLPDPGAGSNVKRAALATSEDCLFLNVFFPGSVVPSEPLPVVFWIHGGGYLAGSASGQNGADLVRESGNSVIAVVIQYRLGLFGFLPGTKVKEGGALNAGLLDQDFALQWVQQHISKFGGDPTKVTIWGESAGAGSVLQHVIARDGQTDPPLFRGAITSSTFLPSQYAFNDPVPEFLYSEVVNQANCNTTDDTLACLRGADGANLQNINTQINRAGFFGTFVIVPVVDGDFITQRATEALKQGKVNGQALLAVTNTHEGNAFVNQSTGSTVDVAQYASGLFPGFGDSEGTAAAQAYADVGTPLDQVNAIMGESIFICPTYFLLSAFAGRGFKAEFAIPPGGHGEDVNFYFPTNGVPAFNNSAFVASFADSFLAFVKDQDPNAKFNEADITPAWSLFNTSNTEMLFNRTEDGQPDIRSITTDVGVLARCSFWANMSALTAQ